jgi:hypothetical protein
MKFANQSDAPVEVPRDWAKLIRKLDGSAWKMRRGTCN